MASGAKNKTTMAKLNRERKLRERRIDKQAKKDARKQAAADYPADSGDVPAAPEVPTDGSGAEPPALEPVARP